MWIETARDIVHAEFDQTYAFMDIDVEKPKPEIRRTVVHVFKSSWLYSI
jgi:hypothetical protein